MLVLQEQPDQYCLEAVGRLAAEFSGILPREVVARTVLAARRDLEGQVAREALAEMLHRLAHHRLNRLRAGACVPVVVVHRCRTDVQDPQGPTEENARMEANWWPSGDTGLPK